MESSETMNPTFTSPAAARDEQGFLRKTYGNLLLAIAAFIGLEAIFFTSGVADALIPLMTQNWLMVIGGFMLLGWLSSYFTRSQVGLGGQYTRLAVTVVLQALIFLPLLGYAMRYSDASVLSSAVLISLIIFGAMTAIVAYSGKNFSFMGPFLGVVGIAALVGIVGSVIFGVTLGFWFSLAMIVFAAATILYETSKVIHEYTDGQHVAGATGLFSSVALLFYYVLMMVVQRD